MNFFEAQHRARKRTKWLVLWFALGVAGTVATLYGATNLLLQFFQTESQHFSQAVNPLPSQVAVGGLVVIFCGSFFKLMQLRQGGSVVAHDMGARPVDSSTQDIDERRLLNVVQEMSIASGIPAPQVWVMDDEPTINAFAAGTEPGNAVVAVSRGCLLNLTRSELQGVVAHEFSHILNGDMRLNIRLIGWLFGLMMIAILGRGIFSILQHTRIRSSGDNKAGGGLLIVVVLSGVLMWLVGSIGVFFGRVIQAAVSRQREYLADASAVQFTRDPSGIAGALKKIASQQGSRLSAPKAAEAAHMFFFSPGGFFNSLLATHPPLIARIKAIEPSWDGKLQALPEHRDNPRQSRSIAIKGSRHWHTAGLSQLGQPGSVNASYGEVLLDSIGGSGSILTLQQAKGMILGMLVAQDGELREQEMRWLASLLVEGELAALATWQSRVSAMNSAQKIALIDMAIPLLRRMSAEEYEVFRDNARRLISSDGQVSLFEFMMERAIERHLAGTFERRDVRPIRWHRLADLEVPISIVICSLCSLSSSTGAEGAFVAVAEEYRKFVARALPRVVADFSQLDQAFAHLDAASPLLKRQILQLCGIAVSHDGVIGDEEIELLRATADAIGSMLPPLQVGHD